MGYRIGSFNLRQLGLTSAGANHPRSLRTIAQIIKEEKFDVVALQEIFSEGKVFTRDYAKKCILNELGGNWKFEYADAGGGNHECYAFLWNANRLNYVNAVKPTEIKSSYAKNFEPPMYQFNAEHIYRKPFYARFTTKGTLGGSNIEFRLICIHTHYGNDTQNDRDIRRRELDVLLKKVYPQIADYRYGTSEDSYTILLGDYNAELWTTESKVWQAPLKKKRGGRMPDILNMPKENKLNLDMDENGIISVDTYKSRKRTTRQIITVQDQLTTLKEKIDYASDEPPETLGYSMNYDHFSYDVEQFDGIKVSVRALKTAVEKYCTPTGGDYASNFEKYLDTVSDHIPIMLEIDFR